MNPDDLPGTDPNMLPYFITEAQTGHIIQVQFASVAVLDQPELRNEDWSQSVFRDVWPEIASHERTLKLVCIGSEDTRIQGMLCVGILTRPGGFLRKNLLESAPFNRHGQQTQAYYGVGRVLVARLVAESVLQGGQGRVVVEPRKGTEKFYRAIGFKGGETFQLSATNAGTLLRATLLPETDEEEKTL